ncbi:hypothetical protein GCM10009123_16480 [Kangiella japonica]|uniref:Uncharacterized protein n=1 Tax=Kangiella japonica TaxID=647384 RepID=A0ABN0T1Y0_9GAMM
MKNQTTLLDEYDRLQTEINFILQSTHAFLEVSEAFDEQTTQGFLNTAHRLNDDFKDVNQKLTKFIQAEFQDKPNSTN